MCWVIFNGDMQTGIDIPYLHFCSIHFGRTCSRNFLWKFIRNFHKKISRKKKLIKKDIYHQKWIRECSRGWPCSSDLKNNKKSYFCFMEPVNDQGMMYKNRVNNNRFFFEIPALLSSQWGNPEREAGIFKYNEFSYSGFPCSQGKRVGISKIFFVVLYAIFIHTFVTDQVPKIEFLGFWKCHGEMGF